MFLLFYICLCLDILYQHALIQKTKYFLSLLFLLGGFMSGLFASHEAVKLLDGFNEIGHFDIYFIHEKNYFESSRFSLCGINNSFFLKVLFKALEIEPQELRSIFHRKCISVPHLFPYNLNWFGFNKNTHYIREVEIPEEISTYDELGYFEYSDREAFKALSKILKKEIDVYKFINNEYVFEFRVFPDGKIAEAIHS